MSEERIKELLTSVGVKPDAAVKKFGTLKTDELRAEALDKTKSFVAGEMKILIFEALNDQPWNEKDYDKFFQTFGLENGLNSASNEQIETVFLDMCKSGMIIQKDIDKRSAQ